MSAREYAAKRLHEFANPVSAVVVDAEDVIDAIMKAMKEEITPKDQTYQEFFGIGEPFLKPPQLIQGYTAENWQEIIDGGYLCEFRNGDGKWKPAKMELKELKKGVSVPFVSIKGNDYSDCRPAQIKGVMRPIFVEPVDKEATCCFFEHGDPLGNGTFTWCNYKSVNMYIKNATSYIEL